MLSPRLRELAHKLTSRAGYVTGAEPFPQPVSEEDAVALVEALHASMDDATTARAEAGVRAGRPVVCAAGCTYCCEEPVMVFLPEALRVARWLERPENAAAKQAFLDAYPAWSERAGGAPERLADASESEDDRAVHEAHLDHWRKRLLCAFNVEGRCSVYPVRPLLCRNSHAVETAERCRVDDPSCVPVARLRSRAFDGFFDRTRSLVRAAHHAMGGPRMRPASICDAVHRLLVSV